MSVCGHTKRVMMVLLLGLASASAPRAGAQDHSWFEKNVKKDPHRYEGLLDQPNAKREYDVLSFFALPKTPLKLENHSELHVRYVLPPDKPQVFIQAKQLRERTNYLMKAEPDLPDAKEQWRDFHWPTSDVIDGHIDPRDLGIMVRLGSDNEYAEDIAPAVFYSSELTAQDVSRYGLTLRIRQSTLASLSCDMKTTETAKSLGRCYYTTSKLCAESRLESGSIEAGSLVTVCMDVGNAESGPIDLHILGRYKNSSEKLVANYRFYHQRQIP